MTKTFTVWLAAGLIGLQAASAPGGETNLLSLRDAEEMAVKNHPKITAAELLAMASKEVVREARSAFFPAVNLDATAVGAAGDNTRIAAGGLNNPLIYNRNAEGVTIHQLITDFGRTANLTSSAKLHSQAEAEGAEATRAQILLEVSAAFYDTLQAQSVLEVAKQTVATRQLVFDQVSTLATNQLKSGLDVSFAKVDLAGGKLLLANAQNDLQADFARLDNLLGEREQRNWLLVDESASNGPPPDATELIQTALRERPDLLQLGHERDAALKFARAERGLNYPTINALGSAGVIPVREPDELKSDYAAAGVNLSLPIFNGFLFTARRNEADLRAEAAAEDLRDAQNDVIRDVRVAVLNVNYALERMTLTDQLLESANEAFDLAQGRYKAGLSSIVELSQAQLNETSAQIEQARAKYQFQVQTAILNYQIGVLR
jgi:outer membrane protein